MVCHHPFYHGNDESLAELYQTSILNPFQHQHVRSSRSVKGYVAIFQNGTSQCPVQNTSWCTLQDTPAIYRKNLSFVTFLLNVVHVCASEKFSVEHHTEGGTEIRAQQTCIDHLVSRKPKDKCVSSKIIRAQTLTKTWRVQCPRKTQ
jgi:hypothetical protein